VMAVGNMPASAERGLAAHFDRVGSSARWGVEKPSPAFFARLVAELDRPAEVIA
jgi:FMN phosphatase YigB (HAD superfamily)